ncbi:NADH-quinone oxidoreductase subunit D [Candidatus Bathyarchaeota archaeon]|nr:MAG: NADH-quinone oxidoreductase subunit D [Candidatus Bathyarchaeota archaeon]
MFNEVFKPLKIIFKNLSRGPMTFKFPPQHQWTDRWRGRHIFDPSKCLSCGLCSRVCPNNAITMVERERNGKKVKYPQIDYRKCSFCGLCVDICPRKALQMSNFPILVTTNVKDLIYTPEKLSQLPKLEIPKMGIKSITGWALSRSLWIINYFTACGFIEAVPWVSSAYDMERFGLIAVPTPSFADVFLIAGYVTVKTLKRIISIYEQMPNPKFVMVFGNCPMNGGTYWDSYHTIKRIEDYIPVDIWIAGCPPRPESIGVAVVLAREAIQSGYRGRGNEYVRRSLPKYYSEVSESKEESREYLVLPMGPQHPATGNFHIRVKTSGEFIEEAELTIGYLHRGFEKLMEYRTWYQNIMLVPRICVLDGAPYEIAYCGTVEKVAGIKVPEKAKCLRVIQAELSRIQSHLINLGIAASAMGFDTFTRITWGDREKVMELLELMSGGRVYQIYDVIGGVRYDVPREFSEKVSKFIKYMRTKLKEYDELFFYNKVVEDRTIGLGILKPEIAWKYDVTGPNIRASGIPFDVRKEAPYEIYDSIDFEVPVLNKGDVYSRLYLRRLEIEESLHIIEQVLDYMPPGRVNVGFKPFQRIPKGEAIHCVESARGELCFHVVSNGSNKPFRVKVRGPTFDTILAVFPKLLKDAEIADVTLIYWSMDNCPADHDR